MAWLRIDDRVRTHPKIVLAGPAAAWFWFCAVCYCREHLTDGFIAAGMIRTLAPGVANGVKLAKTLVAANLFHEAEGGYRIHDFLDWNPTRAEVLKKREEDLNRKKKFQPDSAVDSITDSNRKNAGKNTDASRDRAGARGSGLGYGSGDGSSSAEEGSGETTPAKALISGSAHPGQWGKLHSSHVTGFCGSFVCFPESVFDDFVTRVVNGGATQQDARRQVLAWARSVQQAWAGRIPGDDIFEFWRHEWKKTHGTNKPAGGAGVDVLAGLR